MVIPPRVMCFGRVHVRASSLKMDLPKDSRNDHQEYAARSVIKTNLFMYENKTTLSRFVVQMEETRQNFVVKEGNLRSLVITNTQHTDYQSTDFCIQHASLSILLHSIYVSRIKNVRICSTLFPLPISERNPGL